MPDRVDRVERQIDSHDIGVATELATLRERVAGFMESNRAELNRQAEWRGEISGILARFTHDITAFHDTERNVAIELNNLHTEVTSVRDQSTKDIASVRSDVKEIREDVQGAVTKRSLKDVWLIVLGLIALLSGLSSAFGIAHNAGWIK